MTWGWQPLPAAVAGGSSSVSGVAWNTADKNASISLSDNDKTASASATPYVSVRATHAKGSLQWYFEVLIGGSGTDLVVGIANSGMLLNSYPGGGDTGIGYLSDGRVRRENTTLSTESSYTSGDVIGVAMDVSNGTVRFYKNNVWQASANFNASVVSAPWFPAWAGGTGTGTLRTKTEDFSYSPPSGYVAFDSTINLTADPGSYLLTGAAVNLLAGRTLTAAPGSYALTGTAAGLLTGRRLAADPGSYALTGTAAGLLAGRSLVADPGSYVLTGTDASLVYTPITGFTLVADPGSYSLTGTAAGLLAGRRLAADPGSYSLTGAAAGLLRTTIMPAAPGSYTLTGTTAGLLAARRLTADPGSYTLAGSSVLLSWSGAGAAGGGPKVAAFFYRV